MPIQDMRPCHMCIAVQINSMSNKLTNPPYSPNTSTLQLSASQPRQLANPQAHQLTNTQLHPTYKLATSSTYEPTNASNPQVCLLTNSQTHQYPNSQTQQHTPVRVKDLPRIVPIAYSFQCALAVPRAYSRRNSMQPMPHRDS